MFFTTVFTNIFFHIFIYLSGKVLDCDWLALQVTLLPKAVLTARCLTRRPSANLDRYSLRTNESNHPIFKDHSNQQNILYHLRELLFKNNLIYLQFILAPLVGLAPAKLLDENQGTLLICLQRHLIIQQNILYHTLFTLFKIIFIFLIE